MNKFLVGSIFSLIVLPGFLSISSAASAGGVKPDCPAGKTSCKITGDQCYGDFDYCATASQCSNAKCVALCPCTGRDDFGNKRYDKGCLDRCINPVIVARELLGTEHKAAVQAK